MGPNGLGRAVEKQKMDSYYDLNLNDETMRYVFRIVALKEIMSNPRRYGFYLQNEEKYQPLADFQTLEVDSAIASLGDFATFHGTTYRQLKILNPWLRSSQLTNTARKTFEIRIPRS